ncbi:DUF5808 domain-containing protein [Clostridium sp. E02]|uniref:DUF5808 domain-containing protein n=1 Tax=Clostridium sp. E02 TaxID=2487134 RepID=UPI000F526B7A|nr:DUF5808 domain-containing protein [Clostridium sp. E02]
MKRKKGWFVGEKNIISIDTEVSRLKGKMVLSKFWFIFAFVISIIPVVLLLLENEYHYFSWIYPICSIACVGVGYFAYRLVTKERTVTYSEKTEINLALNQIYKYQWSKCWILQAYIGSILYTLMFFLARYHFLHLFIMFALLGISTCLTFAPILSAYFKVRDKRNNLFLFASSEVYTDEDQYWKTGSYNNPNDKRVWVEKRVGFGTTINMASRSGKFINIFINVILVASVIAVIALSKFLMPLDFGSVELEVKDNIAYINAPMYRDSFSMDDVQEIKKVEHLPKMSKRKGGDSDKFYVGSFNVQGYSNCSVYVHRNTAPYIFVTFSDRVVIFNGNSPEKTEKFYLRLMK